MKFLKFVSVFLVGVLLPSPVVATASEDSGLSEQITSYLSTQTGHYSVTAVELSGSGRSVAIAGDTKVDPASIFKLFYAWLALEKVQQGSLSYSSKLASGYVLGTCLKLMISYSDNSCTSDIRTKLGNGYVNTKLAAAGFTNTRIVVASGNVYKTKETTTNDVATLLSKLYRGQLLNSVYTEKLISLMKAQVWRARISSGLAAGTQVASKSGQLLVSSGMIEGDSAIVYGPNSDYVLVAIGIHNATGAAIRQVSHLVYEGWQGPILTPASYPAAQVVTTTRVYFRSYPGGSIIRSLSSGTAATVLWSERGWVYVKVGTRKGYIYHSYLKLSTRYLNWGTL